MSLSNHYKTLGVSPSATPAEIRSAYLELVRDYRAQHPDTGEQGFEAAYAFLNEAYSALKEPGARAKYDAQLRMLGRACTRCSGAGRVRRQVTFTRVSLELCDACSGEGFYL